MVYDVFLNNIADHKAMEYVDSELSMKDFIKAASRNISMRAVGYFMEEQKWSEKDAFDAGAKIFDAEMESWRSLPDGRNAADAEFVARNVALGHHSRVFDGEVYGLLPDVDKTVDALEKLGRETRAIYDDVLEYWPDKP